MSPKFIFLADKKPPLTSTFWVATYSVPAHARKCDDEKKGYLL